MEKSNIWRIIAKLIFALVFGVILVGLTVLSDTMPDQVDNYIQSDLNIPVNEVNAISVSTLESTVVSSGANLKVYFFDVGNADSTLLVADDKVMLIDAGNKEDGANLAKYIKGLGIKKIDYLIGSNANEEHIGGMETIVKKFDIGIIYMPNVKSPTLAYDNLLKAISSKGLGISSCTIGDTFSLGQGLCTIMNVRNDEQNDLKNSSICLHLVYGNNKFLFMGDLTKDVENDVFYPEVDILKVANHGANTSTSDNFLSQVKPKVAIISTNADTVKGVPSEETIEKLRSLGAEVYRTDEIGTIILTSNGSAYDIANIKTNIDGNINTNSSSIQSNKNN